MTEKQREFVKAYIGECGFDGAKAYMKVYKNCKAENALKQANKLLDKEEIALFTEELLTEREKVATSKEIQAQLTKIMRGEICEKVVDIDDEGCEHCVERTLEVHPRERLKAAELLGKVQGVFAESDEKIEPPVIVDDI